MSLLAIVQVVIAVAKQFAALVELLGLGERAPPGPGVSSTSQSCHSPLSPSARTGAFSEASPPKPAVHRHDVVLGHAELGGDLLDLLGPQVAFLERLDLALHACAG